MENLEIHFKMVDYTKNLLLNATNEKQEKQEKQARHLLDLAKEQENYMEV